MFDAANLCLGICDKIVPGLVIGALSFGHLPVVFAPAGPMVSGLSEQGESAGSARTSRPAKSWPGRAAGCGVRAAYHAAGTCTFYGTANSNQMLMEFMGLQLPGGSFVNPGTELRDAPDSRSSPRIARISRIWATTTCRWGEIVDEKAVVNGIVGLLATGGSTNHTIHLVAIAKAAGISIDWEDFAELSTRRTVAGTRVYPNGMADVNHFHAAGGLGFVIRELLDAGLLHEDVNTILGRRHAQVLPTEPTLEGGRARMAACQAEVAGHRHRSAGERSLRCSKAA